MLSRCTCLVAVWCLIVVSGSADAAEVVLFYHDGSTSQAPMMQAAGLTATNSVLDGSESWRTSWGSAGATPAGALAGSGAGSNWRLWRAIGLNDVAGSTGDYAGFSFTYSSPGDELRLTDLSFDLGAASDNAGTINAEYNVLVSKNGGAFTSLGAGLGVALTTSGGWASNTVVVDVSTMGRVVNGDQFEFRIGLGDNSGSNSKGVFLQGIQLEADAVEEVSLLRVDFGTASQVVEDDYAAFSFNNGAASPQTRNYTFGSTGYDARLIDDGSGITVNLSTKETALRMIDRGTTDKSDRDWATAEPGVGSGQIPDNYIDLTFNGLASGFYTLVTDHIDTSNQVGVMDVQVSVDGGTTFVDYLDNVSYGNFLRQNNISFNAVTGQDVIIRFLAGGGLFGGNGQTTDVAASNRLLPLNAFSLNTFVPTPAALPAGLGLMALVALRRRRK